MASPSQRARMAAGRSAVELLQQRRFLTGYNLVVYGGACAPSAKAHSDNFSIDECNDFDFYTLSSPHSPLPLDASLARRVVVSGGVVTMPHTNLDPTFVAIHVSAKAKMVHNHPTPARGQSQKRPSPTEGNASV
ncbi:hypothetical protein CYMTET_39967 [Cymbomonas tetramitiformis]|uniref:Uncharacterized protein n=1 Tax=Cymbomonas tetramitiformis TaxID=36881 RepID=A0AAE0CB87_9CHLO|nr:hypothetical protein CYMTET_39967 [Cymbomonas tetramitiformis]